MLTPMYKQQQIVACLLISVLIYGGLVAPLYHSVYMAMGEFYPMSHHAGQHGEQQACHESQKQTHLAGVAEMKVPHEGHPECPFMELFSISLLSYVPGDYSLGQERHLKVKYLAAVEEYRQSSSHNAYFLRGPPIA